MLLVGASATTAGARSPEGFPLAAAVATTPRPDPDLRLVGAGFGHGVGMSQVGAYYLGLAGRSAEEILDHYYTDLDLTTIQGDRTLRVGLHRNAATTSLEATGGAVDWTACEAASVTVAAEIGDCGATAGLGTWEQPPGVTWTVTPADGGFEIAGDAAPGGVVAGDRLRIDHHGTRVTWPDVERRRYEHGVRELVRADRGGETVLHVVQELALEDYLPGVAEIAYAWGELAPATLQAQAVAARSYAYVESRRPLGADCSCHLVAVSEDQVYRGDGQRDVEHHGHWLDAVTATRGLIGTHDGTPVPLLYSASHAGHSEHVEDRPATFSPDAATRAVHRARNDTASLERAVAAVNPERTWTATVPNADLATLVDLAVVTGVRVADETDGGTPRVIAVTGEDVEGRTVTRSYEGDGVAGETLRRRLEPVEVRDAADVARTDRYQGNLPSAQIAGFGFATFIDDDGGAHEYSAEFLAALGVAAGTGDGQHFGPGAPVTRAQMASFLDRTFDLPDGGPSAGRFRDVRPGDSHADAIHALAEAGITSGTSEPDVFAPGAPVTRAQMATFLRRAAGYAPADVDGSFDDVAVGDAHAEAIHAIAQRGITAGVAPGRYGPGEPVTRGQMASFLRRVIEDAR